MQKLLFAQDLEWWFLFGDVSGVVSNKQIAIIKNAISEKIFTPLRGVRR